MSAQWYKTRSGLSAVVFATDYHQKRCFLGAYYNNDGEWIPTTWRRGGWWHEEPGHPRGLDLQMEEDETTVSKGEGPETPAAS